MSWKGADPRTIMWSDVKAVTEDNGYSYKAVCRFVWKLLYGGGLAGGWDPWAAAIDPRTGQIPSNAYKSLDKIKCNGYALVQDSFGADFNALPFYLE